MPINPRLITSPGDPAGIASQLSDLNRRVRNLQNVRTVIGQGQITGGASGHIAATSIDASNIAAGAITAGLISAGAINAGHIQANAIGTTHLAAGAVTAGKIAADSITSTEIQASAITTSELAADSVTTAKIAAGQVTGTLIAGNTITGTNIVNGTITSSKISVAQLSAVSADMGNITAGTVTGATFQSSASNPRVIMDSTGVRAQNAAGAVTFKADAATGKIITLTGLGGGNLVPNSSFEDPTGATNNWAVGNATTATETAIVHNGGKSLKLTCSVASTVSVVSANTTAARPAVIPNTDYVGSAWLNTPNPRPAVARIEWYDASATVVGQTSTSTFTPTANTWTRFTCTGTAPATATSCRLRLICANTGAVIGDVFYVDDLQLEEGTLPTAYAAKPDEILPETISGSGAGAGAQIVPGTIIGSDLVANTITAGQIAAGTITATELAANSVIAGKIAAGSVDATKISVATLSAISANMGTITAGTITGATMRTSATNPRVELNSSGLVKTDSSGNNVVQLGATNGLDLLAGTTTTPPTDRKLRWLRESDSAQVAELTAYRTGVGSSAVGLHIVDPDDADRFGKIDTTIGTTSTVISADAGFDADSASLILLRNDGASSFVKAGVGAPADRRLNIGTVNLTFSASTFSNQVTVNHGLGATPIGVFTNFTGAAGTGTMIVAPTVLASTATQFTIQGKCNVTASTTVTCMWLALA
jgi:hypothetical protein